MINHCFQIGSGRGDVVPCSRMCSAVSRFWELPRSYVHSPRGSFPKILMNHLGELMEVYGKFSAFDLERLSCDEEPWKAAQRWLKNGGSGIISCDVMKHFYRLRIDGSKK